MRTPTDYRATLARWRETAPANDSNIISRAPHPARPRHRDLADKFAPLLTWRRLRAASEADDVQSTWLADIAGELLAANDNEPLNEDGYHDVRPTVPELMAAIADVEFASRGGRLVPVGGDIERDREGRIVRLGRLAISDDPPAHVLGLYTTGRDGRRRLWRASEEWRPRKTDGLTLPSAEPIDPAEGRAARREMQRLTNALSAEDLRTLDAALEAASFTSIGEAFGKVGKTAERFGKTRLLAACAALQAALVDEPMAA